MINQTLNDRAEGDDLSASLCGKMEVIRLPFYRSHPTSTVLRAEDTVITLYPTHLSLRVNSVEETLKDTDDPYLGSREKVRQGTAVILRNQIVAIETTWDEDCEAYDVNIYTNSSTWGYNIAESNFASNVYRKLTDWLVGAAG